MFEGKEVKVILSQAGGGKTTHLMKLIEKDLETKRPEEIAFLTFTKKGAEEGVRRICNLYGYSPDELPYFRTLHSLTYHALNLQRENLFCKVSENDFNRTYGYYVNRSEKKGNVDIETKDSLYLDYYDAERSGALTSKDISEADIEISYYRQIVHDYEEYKSQRCLADFFDCLVKYEQSGNPLPCKVVYVDEAQDLTALQWKVVERASVNAEKIYIAGDENQAIFTYNGGRADIFLTLAKQYKCDYLKESYRIPRKVFALAKGIVGMIDEKTNKPFDFHEGNKEGSVVEFSDVDRLKNFFGSGEQLHDKTTCDWYLLARNKCFFKKYTCFLEQNLIPYWTPDGFFMTPPVLSRIKDYMGFRLEGYKNESKRQEFAEKFGIKDFTKPFTDTSLFTEDRKWIYATFIEHYGFKKLCEMSKWNPQILVSTIHHVKGGEAENVAILLSTTKRTSGVIYDSLDDELRVLYVGITRAKSNLFLIDGDNSKTYTNILNTVRDQYSLSW
jgi:Superfamily I DNA and RNA helicases